MPKAPARINNREELLSYAREIAAELGGQCFVDPAPPEGVCLVDDEGRGMLLWPDSATKLDVLALVPETPHPFIGVSTVSPRHVADHIRRRLYPLYAEALKETHEKTPRQAAEEENRVAAARQIAEAAGGTLTPSRLFLSTWATREAAEDVANLLNCTQAEALAGVLHAGGYPAIARAWIYAHTKGDDRSTPEEHHPLTAVIDRTRNPGVTANQLRREARENFVTVWSDEENLIAHLAGQLDCERLDSLRALLAYWNAGQDTVRTWLAHHAQRSAPCTSGHVDSPPKAPSGAAPAEDSTGVTVRDNRAWQRTYVEVTTESGECVSATIHHTGEVNIRAELSPDAASRLLGGFLPPA